MLPLTSLERSPYGGFSHEQAEALPADQRVHQVAVEATIDQLPGVAGTLGVVLDGISRNLLAPEGVRSFGNRHAFAGAGIEDGERARGWRQCGQRPFQCGLIGREIAVFDEVARKAREHESHKNLLKGSGMKEDGHARRACPYMEMTQATRRSGAPEASSYRDAPRVPLRIRSPSAVVSAGTSIASR